MPKKKVSLAKRSKVSQEKLNREMRVTVYFGYGLFLLVAIGLMFTVVPWMRFYQMDTVNPFNITMLLVSFVFTALAPALVGYLAGDGATQSKSKLVHHYNGVLFGVLGVWLWLVATMLITYAQQWIPIANAFDNTLLNLTPAIIAALTTIGLGMYYAKKTRHQVALIDYRPFRVVIIVSAVGLVVSVAISAIISSGFGSNLPMTLLINLVTPALFMLVAGLAGYWIIGVAGGTTGERIVRSVIAVGLAIIGLTIFGQLFAYIAPVWDKGSILYAMAFVVLIWAGYLLLIRRALSMK